MSRTVRRSRYRAGPAHHPLPPTVDAVGRNHLSPLPPHAADAAAVHIIALAESRLSLLPFWNLQAGKTKPIFLMLATEARFARYSSQIAYSESHRRAYQVLAKFPMKPVFGTTSRFENSQVAEDDPAISNPQPPPGDSSPHPI